MIESTRRRNGVRLIALSAACLASGVLANQARAQNQYFDVNGATTSYGVVNNTTYSWDDNNWGVSGGAGATTAWGPGTFARFYATSAAAYTVTVANTESMVGLYLNTGSGAAGTAVALTINQAASTSGGLSISTTGASAPAGGGAATLQGFLISATAGSVVINAPISGAGGIEQQLSGSLSLYGNNSYAGGTETTGGQVLNYNNNNSFGTGTITLSGTSGQGIVNNGPSGLTVANNFVFATVGSLTNFVGGSAAGNTPGTNWTGTFTLPASGAC